MEYLQYFKLNSRPKEGSILVLNLVISGIPSILIMSKEGDE